MEYDCVVVRVVDGDTLDVTVDLGFGISTKQRVRLKGVDAPETFRPSCESEREHGKAAKQFVADRCLDMRCKLVTDHGKCKYGRTIADLYPPGSEMSLAELLRLHGLQKKDDYRYAMI